MAGETQITIVGNLTSDPELRFTADGPAVASFTIASTPRTFDRQSGQFKEGQALFMRCSAWREMAENVAETLTKGMRVIAQGRLQQRSFETQQGEKRTVVEMQVDEIGPSLRFASAQVKRNARSDSGFNGGGGPAGGRGYGQGGGNMGGGYGYDQNGGQNQGQYGGYGQMGNNMGGYGGNGQQMPMNTNNGMGQPMGGNNGQGMPNNGANGANPNDFGAADSWAGGGVQSDFDSKPPF